MKVIARNGLESDLGKQKKRNQRGRKKLGRESSTTNQRGGVGEGGHGSGQGSGGGFRSD